MYQEVTRQLLNVLWLLEEEKKKPKDYGGGIELYHAEVIFLECISRNHGENVSGLARCLRVTKGAITQISAKLLQKALIALVKREGNKKEKYYRLTRLGQQVLRQHHMDYEEANHRMYLFFSELRPSEMDVLSAFLEQLTECMPFCEFTCAGMKENNKEEDDESSIAQCTRVARGTQIRR